jgi:hypothetical protein
MKSIRLQLIGAPLLALAAAFVTICVHFQTAWPWNVAVHEDGRRTLLRTIFYFEHALGELPLELLLAGAVAGALLRHRRPDAAARTLLPVLVVAVLAIDALILFGSWWNVGFTDSRMFLLQYHTRDRSPLEFGSHWRYHLLSQATLMLAPAMIAGAASARLLRASWAAFTLGCIVFGVSALSFADPQYLGHQARETVTHGLITIPLAVGLCLGLSQAPEETALRVFWPAAFGFTLLGFYQAAAVIATGSRQYAQMQDLVRVVCGHFFEHTLSYLVVPVHAALFYLAGALRSKS